MFEIDLTQYRVVDLSFTVVPGENGDRPFVVRRGLLADDAFKYDIEKTHSHVGTHVEFPGHFFEGGKTGTEFPLAAFMGRGILLPVRLEGGELAITSDYLDTTIGDIIRDHDIVVARNDGPPPSPDNSNVPYFTPDSAYWLQERQIKMLVLGKLRLGKDIPGGRQFHDILMSQDVNFVEIVDSLDQLQKREFYFMALPFKVEGLDSAWARAIAIEEIG